MLPLDHHFLREVRPVQVRPPVGHSHRTLVLEPHTHKIWDLTEALGDRNWLFCSALCLQGLRQRGAWQMFSELLDKLMSGL